MTRKVPAWNKNLTNPSI